ncbi:MAG: acyl-[acyl-carrier-protein] thioesterase [Enterocloster bolteae]
MPVALPGIINYMQDCSTFQSEDAGVGVGYLDSELIAHGFLSSWRIMIDRYPEAGGEVWWWNMALCVKGIYGYRDFRAAGSGKGRLLVRAESMWFLYDTEKNMPIRVQPEDTLPYGTAGAVSGFGTSTQKDTGAGRLYETGEPIVVARHHIDTNHHVNNAQYVDMAREAIPEGLKIREIRADYKKAAVLGDVGDSAGQRWPGLGSGQWSLKAIQESSAQWYGLEDRKRTGREE